MEKLVSSSVASREQLLIWYIVEGITSIGTTLLSLGIFFYMRERFGWGWGRSFLLACGQGVIYTTGALMADRLQARFGRQRLLAVLYVLMALISALALFTNSSAVVAGLLLAYVWVAAMNWPALESLVASDVGAKELSRRVGIYNLVWAGTGAIAIAANGLLIQKWPAGVFLVPTIVHIASCALIMISRRMESVPAPMDSDSAAHLEPERELLRMRTLALWLSRISLPATYVVIYSLMAMLPSMSAITKLPLTLATPVGGVWIMSRWLTFLILGATTWWHTRPWLLALASVTMLIAFVFTVTPAAELWIWSRSSHVLEWLIVAQIVLGLALGMIYSGSLYFGMVLSQGSTEHGGYHEALIGLGQVLGPGIGALVSYAYPGNAAAGIVAVSCVVGVSVAAVVVVTALKRVSTTPTL